MATWPVTLPQDPLLGWTESLPNNTIRSETAAGPAKVRRRYTSAPRQFEIPLALTDAQMDTLDSFYESTLAGGSLSFDWLHPRTGQSKSFRFLAPPKATEAARGLYRMTLQLEMLP